VRIYEEPAGPIYVGIEESFAIALAGNPTTGYEWQASADPNYLELRSRKFELGAKAVGAGGRELFHFRALRAGETEVVFEYQRPWERTALETRRCKLVIRGPSAGDVETSP
jgi:predicted secreted protein